MQAAAISELSQVVQAAHQIAQSDLDACDASDIEELLEPIDRELQSIRPNSATLTTYLNSLGRSLRGEPSARRVCVQLHSAMRAAGLPVQWDS